ITLTRIHWSALGLALLGAALFLTSQSARLWVRQRVEALSAAVLSKPHTAPGQIQVIPLAFTVTERRDGGKCLEFGAPPPQPHQAIIGNPLFISDCNGTAAQQVRVEEINDRHEVILRMGNGVIGRNAIPVVILQTGFAAQAGAIEQTSSAAAN